VAENLRSILSVFRAVTPSLSIKIRVNKNYENSSLDVRLLAQRFVRRSQRFLKRSHCSLFESCIAEPLAHSVVIPSKLATATDEAMEVEVNHVGISGEAKIRNEPWPAFVAVTLTLANFHRPAARNAVAMLYSLSTANQMTSLHSPYLRLMLFISSAASLLTMASTTPKAIISAHLIGT
jgi:hypothetical protein